MTGALPVLETPKTYEPRLEKNRLFAYAKNKDTDQLHGLCRTRLETRMLVLSRCGSYIKIMFLHRHQVSVFQYLSQSWREGTWVRVVCRGRHRSVSRHQPPLHDHSVPPSTVLSVHLCVYGLLRAPGTWGGAAPWLVFWLLHDVCSPVVSGFQWGLAVHAEITRREHMNSVMRKPFCIFVFALLQR